MTAAPSSTAERIAIAAVCCIAAWVHAGHVWLSAYHIDQAEVIGHTMEIARGEHFPLLGQSSGSHMAGHLFGPLLYYLLALPALLGGKGAVLAAGVLIFVPSVFLLWRAGRALFGPRAGIAAAALYAASPGLLVETLFFFQVGLYLFLALAFLEVTRRFVMEQRPWGLAWSLALTGMLLQMHVTAVLFVAVLVAAIAIYRPPLRPGPVIAGVTAVAACYAPWVVAEVQTGGADVQRFLAWSSANGPAPGGATYLVVVGRAIVAPFLLPGQSAQLYPGALPIWEPWAARAGLGLGALGLGALLLALRRAGDRRPYLLLAAWLVVPYLLYPLGRTGVISHHFVFAAPALYLTLGLGADMAARGRRAMPAGALIAGLVALSVAIDLRLERAVETAGVVRLPGAVLLSAPDRLWRVPPATLDFFTAATARELWAHLSALGPSEALDRTVHGTVYEQLRLAPPWQARVAASAAAQGVEHIVSTRELGCPEGRVEWSGAYCWASYRPALSGKGWRGSAEAAPAWWSESFDDASWAPLSFPARGQSKALDQGFFRERVTPAPSHGRVVLRVDLFGPVAAFHPPPQISIALHVNGAPVTPQSRVSLRGVWPIEEAVFDLTAVLRPEENLLALEVKGADPASNLDAYEVPAAP